ncbi:MAG: HupE/UreJ family protein [Rhodocyclaceae bacterium]|nr:HupE/UreJ family protein [Rhodocyclaceae bacterium]
MNLRHLLVGIPLAVASTVAAAHPGHLGGSLLAGFAHPVLGLDHLLAMLAIGAYAAQRPGRAGWALPATFVLAMLGGAVAAALGLSLPWIEQGIAASLIVLGVLLACTIRVADGAVAALVAGVAVLHGHAHYLDMGHQAAAAYASGFAAAAVAIQAAGYGLARRLPASRAGRWLKGALGGVVALAGLFLLAG